MTTEQAIEYWIEFQQEAIEMCDMALAALRAQQEREKGCDWCKAMFNTAEDTKAGEIITSDKLWYTFDGDGGNYYKKANFCPMCGRKLEPKEVKP